MASKWLNVVFVIWGTVEIVLFAGLIYGWASLVYVFKLEGYFKNLCDDDNANKYENVSASLALTGTSESYSSTPAAYQHVVTYDILNIHSNIYHNTSQITARDKLNQDGNSPEICPEQDAQFNLIYTLSTLITGSTLFLTGWMLDKYGVRICRVIGIILYVSSLMLIGFSSAENAILLYPGVMLLGFGGYFWIFTNFQLGNLIPEKRSTIIALCCGAYDSSSFMMVLVKFAYEAGISIRISFLALMVLFSMVIVSTFTFMPRTRIPVPLPLDYKLPIGCCPSSDNLKITQDNTIETKQGSQEDKPIEQKNGHSSKEAELAKQKENLIEKNGSVEKTRSRAPLDSDTAPSFFSVATSPLFIWDCVWLCCQRFASWSYVGRLNPTLNRLANGDTAIVSRYISIYASMQFCGIILAPLSGRLLDRKTAPTDCPKRQKINKLMVCIPSLVLDSTVGLLLAIMCTIPILEVQYASFALHVIHRAFLYGPNSAFVAKAFPPQHFGKLFGLGMSISAIFSMLQYPFFMLIQGPLGGDPLMVDLFVLALMLLAYCLPVYIVWWCRSQRKQLEKEQANNTEVIALKNKSTA